MNVFRLRSWTTHEKKVPRGTPGIRSATFKARRPDLHCVVVECGSVPDIAEIEIPWLIDRLETAMSVIALTQTVEVPS